jgi:hypothetical protein
MSIILLSLLLLILVGLGGLMSKQVAATAEYFDNPPATMEVAVVEMSPALANLLDTPRLVAEDAAKPVPQVDVLKRERDAIAAASQKKKQRKDDDEDDDDDTEYPRRDRRRKHKCPKCPKCPDMSQYVRLDEVPCWNCTLP